MGACEEKVNEREVGTEELKLSYVGEMNGKYVQLKLNLEFNSCGSKVPGSYVRYFLKEGICCL